MDANLFRISVPARPMKRLGAHGTPPSKQLIDVSYILQTLSELHPEPKGTRSNTFKSTFIYNRQLFFSAGTEKEYLTKFYPFKKSARKWNSHRTQQDNLSA